MPATVPALLCRATAMTKPLQPRTVPILLLAGAAIGTLDAMVRRRP
jgi:hypothetical protein